MKLPKVKQIDIKAIFESAAGHPLKQETKNPIALPPAPKEVYYPNNSAGDTIGV